MKSSKESGHQKNKKTAPGGGTPEAVIGAVNLQGPTALQL